MPYTEKVGQFTEKRNGTKNLVLKTARNNSSTHMVGIKDG